MVIRNYSTVIDVTQGCYRKKNKITSNNKKMTLITLITLFYL